MDGRKKEVVHHALYEQTARPSGQGGAESGRGGLADLLYALSPGKRDLAGNYSVYSWVDEAYLEARLEQPKQCLAVIVGPDEAGKKKLVGLYDGYWGSAQDPKHVWIGEGYQAEN